VGIPVSISLLLAPRAGDATVLTVVALVLAALYLAGVVRLRLRGMSWSALRTLTFLSGSLALVVVSTTGIEHYGTRLLSVFMFQQLTLMIAVPPLLVAGAPGTLLLRACSHRGAGRWVLMSAHGALRSRAARWVLHPAFTIPLFLLAFYGLYLGGLADRILRLDGGHVLLEMCFLVAGVVVAVPVLSRDPLPERHSGGRTALEIFAEMGLHAFFGVIVMMGTSLLVPMMAASTSALGVDPLADQRAAGGLAWGYGEGPTLILLLVVISRWRRAEQRREAIATLRADREGDLELESYNRYLAELASRDTRLG